MVKQAAFQEELIKLGYVGVIAKLLTKMLPKAIMSVAKIVGKGKTLAKSRGVAGSAYRYLNRSRAQRLGVRETFRGGISGAAKKFGPYKSGVGMDYAKVNLKTRMKDGPTARPWLGKSKGAIMKSNVKDRTYARLSKQPLEWLKTRPQAWGGELATNLNFIRSAGTGGKSVGLGKGLGRYAKSEVKKGMTFKKITGGAEHTFERSLIGKGLGPTLTTGVGFGGISFAAGGTNASGQKVGLGKRTGRAVGEAALWSLAPGAAMASITPSLVKEVGGMAKALF